MPHHPAETLRRAIASALSGSIALALLTWFCFWLRLNLATTECLFLTVIALLSLQGSFVASAVVSLVGVGALDYYFTPPLYSFWIADPHNLAAIIAFLTVSAVITRLVSTLRSRAEQLALANAQLEAQIAERKQAQEALGDARSDLERVSRVNNLGELTASIAHEINQPLTAAVTNANACSRWLAGDQPNLAEARAAALRIVQDGTRAAGIISRIRLLFKKGAPQREPVDVNDIIREMIALLHSETTRYSISVRTELAADLPQVMGDRVQLQQVLMNLIINSVDAMRDVDGARELAIKSLRAENERLLVSVSDTGVGLPPQQDQIFNAFFTTKHHGTGMGLSISRSILEAHGGRLFAADNPPRGASFSLTLPIRAAQDFPSPYQPQSRHMHEARERTKGDGCR
jgi:C4-dicarboxylate-specific signal transduction histidine kinase